jgi:hypothetical protein
MTPRIGDEVHTFIEHGLYDGLFLMRDDETGTFWDHMTGDAVYGPLVGTKLDVSNLRQTTVAQALGEDPDVLVAISERSTERAEAMTLQGLLSRVGGRLSRMFRSTVDEEDDRLPTMDLGMGVWEGAHARYYPYDRVLAGGRAVLDSFEGRTLLVYLDPAAYALSALYVTADGFEWDEKVLRLSDGSYVEGGVYFGADGERAEAVRPLQIFTRWYGFALTFPGTEIYGEPLR